jgi:hypothetical protein
MPNTAGFQVVAEIDSSVLNQLLTASYESTSDTHIPHSVAVPAGTTLGPYVLSDGTLNIPESGLSATPDPALNAIDLGFDGIEIQVDLQNPPVSSLSMLAMTANLSIIGPLGVFMVGSNSFNVGLNFTGLPLSDISVTLTSDPIGPVTAELLTEWVQARWTDGTIPHTIQLRSQQYGPVSGDVTIFMLNDPSLPGGEGQISVTLTGSGQVQVTLPFHFYMSNVNPAPLATPFGCLGAIVLTQTLVTSPGSISADLATASASCAESSIKPWPESPTESANYTTNATLANLYGTDLAQVIASAIQAEVPSYLAPLNTATMDVPIPADIEQFIAGQIQGQLVQVGDLALWTPNAGGNLTISNVTPQALTGALAICINSGPGANPSALGSSFIPAGRDFAIGISADLVNQTVTDHIHQTFGANFPSTPYQLSNVDGHSATLKSLTVALATGHFHADGDVTVHDAIAGSIDVDASFWADIGLTWVAGPSGTQIVQATTLGSGTGIGLLYWIVGFLLGFISFGLVGDLVVGICLGIADSIANSVGAAVITNDVTQQVEGIGAWPQQVEGVATVTAQFANPIGIDTDGIVFSG